MVNLLPIGNANPFLGSVGRSCAIVLKQMLKKSKKRNLFIFRHLFQILIHPVKDTSFKNLNYRNIGLKRCTSSRLINTLLLKTGKFIYCPQGIVANILFDGKYIELTNYSRAREENLTVRL